MASHIGKSLLAAAAITVAAAAAGFVVGTRQQLWYRRTSRGHLVAKGCLVFVVELNNYSITGDDSMSLT